MIPVGAFFAAVGIHFAFGKWLGFPAVVWSPPVYGGAMGWALQSFNAITPVLGFSLAIFNAAVIVQEFVAALSLSLQDRRREDPEGALVRRASCPASSIRWRRCRRAAVVATAATSSTSASCSCSSASPASRGRSIARPRIKQGDTLPGRAIDHQVRRPAHGGRQHQAHGLRGREGLRRRQRGRQALAGEVHLQEDAGLADHRGRDVPLDPRRPLPRRREHQPRDQGGFAPDPPESPRGMDLVRVPGADLRQLHLHVAGVRAAGVARLAGRERRGRDRDQHHARHPAGALAGTRLRAGRRLAAVGQRAASTTRPGEAGLRRAPLHVRDVPARAALFLRVRRRPHRATQTRARLRARLAKGDTPERSSTTTRRSTAPRRSRSRRIPA